MISQEKIDAHSRATDSRVLALEHVLSAEVESVASEVVNRLASRLSIKDGKVVHRRGNASAILGVEDDVRRMLGASMYYPTIMAFAEDLREQADAFREFYVDMASDVELPPIQLDDHGRDSLSTQAASAVGAIESVGVVALARLSELMGRSLAVSNWDHLANVIHSVVTRIAQVGPIARDSIMTWFRLFSRIVYQGIESGGRQLRYSYVGPSSEDTRDFCKGLVGVQAFTLDEFAEMDNGQVPDVATNGGGYGCRHWLAVREYV